MNQSNKQMLEDLEDTINQTYAMMNPEEIDRPIAPERDAPTFNTTDTPHSPELSVDIDFITSLYRIYFDLKIIHWNTFSNKTHIDSDEAIKLLLEFIDNYTEVTLTKTKDLANIGDRHRHIIPIDFINMLCNQLKTNLSNYSDTENSSLTFNNLYYTDVLDSLLFRLTVKKSELDLCSSNNAETTKLAIITAKQVLVEDMISKIVKLTYKGSMF